MGERAWEYSIATQTKPCPFFMLGFALHKHRGIRGRYRARYIRTQHLRDTSGGDLEKIVQGRKHFHVKGVWRLGEAEDEEQLPSTVTICPRSCEPSILHVLEAAAVASAYCRPGQNALCSRFRIGPISAADLLKLTNGEPGIYGRYAR